MGLIVLIRPLLTKGEIMGLFDWWSSRSRHVRGRTPSPEQPLPLGFERLETRTLLDASASLAGGLLTVTGGMDKDRIDLALDRTPNQLVVRDAGQEVARYDSATVTNIVIASGGSSHNVRIAQDVLQPATVQGGPGHIILWAGGGPATLMAGDGNDKLIGGTGAGTLIGGAGRNILVGRSGQDVLQAGSGSNLFIIKGNDTVLGAKPGDQVIGQLDPPPGPGIVPPNLSPDPPKVVLTPDEVQGILQRAAVADPNDDAIVAVVDRGGRLLGVRVEGNVAPEITSNNATLSFAIDGAIAEARTGAFFGNDQAPLTSRTIQFISQSTITQREVDSNPNITDPNSTVRGPGFVAPIEIGGHFPPGVSFTPQVDLFNIEGTNRDSSTNLIPGDGRFNVAPQFLPPGGEGTAPPDAYGTITGLPGGSTQGRGIGTLPGGIPIYKVNPANNQEIEVGGIGVFFPGKTGYASAENSSLSADYNPSLPDRSLEAELVAVAALGGSENLSSNEHDAPFFRTSLLNLPNAPTLPEIQIAVTPPGRIDLVGITLDIIGPGGSAGPDVLLRVAGQIHLGTGNPNSGVNMPVNQNGDLFQTGQAVPEGWLVTPHDGVGITAADVVNMVNNGITQANKTRAAIRLPLDSLTKMVFAVADKNGALLGLYRMPDATIFSIDVAVAKARNVAYYNDPTQLQPIDQVPGVTPGTAFTNRTFRYLAEPRFPEGIDGRPPGPFSILNDGGTDPGTGLNVGPPLPASAFQSVLGHDAFNPGTNFHDPNNLQYQNGIVFFPGSSGVYKAKALVGGFGVSGDGVDQDDVVTTAGASGFEPTPAGVARADEVSFRGVNLPYNKFNRQPQEP
jgi:uncharacterized protein GlcG (DUF336 family)